MPTTGTDCYSCRVDGSLERQPPSERVAVGAHWRAAVDLRSTLPGWLVLLPRRHVTGVHELTAQEAAALGPALHAASTALVAATGCLRTYLMAFGEADGFAHLHVHVVPRMLDQPADRRGPAVFGYCDGEPPSTAERDEIAARLAAAWPDEDGLRHTM